MARLHGEYESDESREPTRIDVSGTADEIRRAKEAAQSPGGGGYAHGSPRHWTSGAPIGASPTDTDWHLNIPADREAVKQIARKVEIACDDARLIDWMRA